MAEREIGKAAVGSMLLGMVQTNCYFVYKEDGRDHSRGVHYDDPTPCVFFDPADRGELIYDELTNRGYKVEAIYLTHAHFDHFLGVDKLRELSGAKVYVCEKDKKYCEDPFLNLSAQFVGQSYTVKPDGYVHEGDVCEAAGFKFKVFETPGHTEGSCCYYFEDDGIVISGDTLFEGSVGRTDFPLGSAATLSRSIREKLFTLPEETIVYPGHNDITTIGYEKKYNSFV